MQLLIQQDMIIKNIIGYERMQAPESNIIRYKFDAIKKILRILEY